MQPRDWFSLAVRIAALVFLVFSLFDVFYVLAKILGLETQSKVPLSTDLAASIFYAVIAVVGFGWADRLGSLTYGPPKRD